MTKFHNTVMVPMHIISNKRDFFVYFVGRIDTYRPASIKFTGISIG